MGYAGAIGLKTGYTEAAGRCFVGVVAARRPAARGRAARTRPTRSSRRRSCWTQVSRSRHTRNPRVARPAEAPRDGSNGPIQRAGGGGGDQADVRRPRPARARRDRAASVGRDHLPLVRGEARVDRGGRGAPGPSAPARRSRMIVLRPTHNGYGGRPRAAAEPQPLPRPGQGRGGAARDRARARGGAAGAARIQPLRGIGRALRRGRAPRAARADRSPAHPSGRAGGNHGTRSSRSPAHSERASRPARLAVAALIRTPACWAASCSASPMQRRSARPRRLRPARLELSAARGAEVARPALRLPPGRRPATGRRRAPGLWTSHAAVGRDARAARRRDARRHPSRLGAARGGRRPARRGR